MRESQIDSSFIGFTMPLVPSIEIPPVTPSRGLNVFLAVRSPSGTETVTLTALPPRTSLRASQIILRGAGLMAGSPGGTLSPASVTVPTPLPAANVTGPSESPISREALTVTPFVMSGSSPASLTTPQEPSAKQNGSSVRTSPCGVATETRAGHLPVSASSAAALAAAAAQEPVEIPSLSAILQSMPYRSALTMAQATVEPPLRPRAAI